MRTIILHSRMGRGGEEERKREKEGERRRRGRGGRETDSKLEKAHSVHPVCTRMWKQA